MRTIISPKEAAYIVELLLATKPMLEKKQRTIQQLIRETPALFERAKIEGVITFRKYKVKKAELDQLKPEAYELYRILNLHSKLIAKFSAIRDGTATKGRMKHLRIEAYELPRSRCNLSKLVSIS